MFFYDINIPSNYGYICQKRIFDENYTSKMHWHSVIELEFLIEGSGIHHYNGKSEPVNPGDLWLLTLYDSHQMTIHEGSKLINLSIDPEILHEKIQNKLSLSHPIQYSLSKKESQCFLAKVDTLLYEQEHREFLSRVKVTSVINDIFVDVLRQSTSSSMQLDNSIVLEMVEYLQKHYLDNMSLTQFSKIFALTPNYCGYIFKKTLGVSYNDYVNILKLKSACKALQNSNLPIKQIATESGFSSVEYFYAIFKKYYGITPAKYKTLTSSQITSTVISKYNSV